MEFHVSDEHLRGQNRKAICLILFLSIISIGLLVKLLSADKVSDWVFPIIGLLVFGSLIFSSCRRIREGKAGYPVLELDESNRKIAVLYKDIKVIVDLSQIKNLRLQRKSGRVVSILIKTSSGENLRFNGYENINVLTSILERLTPKENITNASFYHR